jgi:hypothetical protein
MSLLGITIDQSLVNKRLEDKTLGYVEGTNDERLLKEIGAIVLQKGVWTLKYSGSEVADFLNWVAEGKPHGILPVLAKRLLCLKREKLARGIKDAGTSNYARGAEAKQIAEIDAIFKQTGTDVECVVDITKETIVENNTPSPILSSINAPVITSSQVVKLEEDKKQENKARTDDANTYDQILKSETDSAPSKDDALILKTLGKFIDAMDTSDKHREPLLTILSKLASTDLEKEKVAIINNLITNLDTQLIENIKELFRILDIKQNEHIGRNEQNEHNGRNDRNDQLSEDNRIKKAVENALLQQTHKTKHKYVCEDKIHCLQQLVYTTCGEASFLDPLIDHINKLLATFYNSNSEKIKNMKEILENLHSDISSEALKLENNNSRSALTNRLHALQSALESLNEPSAVKNTLVKDATAVIARKNSEKDRIKAEIDAIMLELASENSKDKRELVKLQLEEEKGYLNTLKHFVDEETSEQIDKFLETINASINNPSLSTRSLTSGCNSRAATYRKMLEKAREEALREIKDLRANNLKELDSLRAEKDAEIQQIKNDAITAADASERSFNETISKLNNELKTLRAQNDQLQTQMASLKEASNLASIHKNMATSKAVELEAKVKIYESEIKQLRESSASKNTNLESIQAQQSEYEEIIAGLEAKLKELENTRIHTNVQSKKALEDEIAELKARLESVTSFYDDNSNLYIRQLKEKHNELIKTSENRNTLRTQLNDLETIMATEKAKTVQQSDYIESLRSELDATTINRNSKDAVIADLKRKVDEASSKNTQITQLQSELEKSSALQTELEDKIANLKAYANELAATKESEISKLMAQLQSANKNKNTNATTISKLTSDLALARSSKINSDASVAQLMADLETKKKECDTKTAELQTKVSNILNEVNARNNDIARLRTEVEKLSIAKRTANALTASPSTVAPSTAAPSTVAPSTAAPSTAKTGLADVRSTYKEMTDAEKRLRGLSLTKPSVVPTSYTRKGPSERELEALRKNKERKELGRKIHESTLKNRLGGKRRTRKNKRNRKGIAP